MGQGYKVFENLGNLMEKSRIKRLNESLEIAVEELTNGAVPPYSEFTEGVLHDFDEVRETRFRRGIFFE